MKTTKKDKIPIEIQNRLFRKVFQNILDYEKDFHIKFQTTLKCKFLDQLCLFVSLFGTTTAYVIIIPLFFIFGSIQIGCEAMSVLAIAIYSSHFAKDYYCLDRPKNLPFNIKESEQTNDEFGLPSTHTMAITTFVSYLIMKFNLDIFYSIQLLSLVFIMGFSRYYCGMHSMLDVFMGVLIGIPVSYFWNLFWEQFYLFSSTSKGYLINFAFCLFILSSQPKTYRICPCFKDSICVISVILGQFLGFQTRKIEISNKSMVNTDYKVQIFLFYITIFSWKVASKLLFTKLINICSGLFPNHYFNRAYLDSFCIYFGIGFITTDFIYRIYDFIN